jgi:hypothetical protein
MTDFWFLCVTEFLTYITQIYAPSEQPVGEFELRALIGFGLESAGFSKVKYC